jgi:hypothetical protein
MRICDYNYKYLTQKIEYGSAEDNGLTSGEDDKG